MPYRRDEDPIRAAAEDEQLFRALAKGTAHRRTRVALVLGALFACGYAVVALTPTSRPRLICHRVEVRFERPPGVENVPPPESWVSCREP
jgi:hypothetical protein